MFGKFILGKLVGPCCELISSPAGVIFALNRGCGPVCICDCGPDGIPLNI